MASWKSNSTTAKSATRARFDLTRRLVPPQPELWNAQEFVDELGQPLATNRLVLRPGLINLVESLLSFAVGGFLVYYSIGFNEHDAEGGAMAATIFLLFGVGTAAFYLGTSVVVDRGLVAKRFLWGVRKQCVGIGDLSGFSSSTSGAGYQSYKTITLRRRDGRSVFSLIPGYVWRRRDTDELITRLALKRVPDVGDKVLAWWAQILLILGYLAVLAAPFALAFLVGRFLGPLIARHS